MNNKTLLKIKPRIDGNCMFCGIEFQDSATSLVLTDYALSVKDGEIVQVADNFRDMNRRNPATYLICPGCAISIRSKLKKESY